jgi:hypothetical protein
VDDDIIWFMAAEGRWWRGHELWLGFLDGGRGRSRSSRLETKWDKVGLRERRERRERRRDWGGLDG